MTAFWTRGGMAHVLTRPGIDPPVGQRPAFGDHSSAMNLAFGIAGALFRRERTGEASVVDVSLLSTAMWVLSSDVVYCGNPDYDPHVPPAARANPLSGTFRCADGRYLTLVFLQPDRYWPDLCRHMGLDRLIDDPRFADMEARRQNSAECARIVQETFASRTYDEWREAFDSLDAPWAPMQSVRELRDDPQARANGYMAPVESPAGASYELVANPVQFDETPHRLTPAPEIGAHTEEVLLELGLSWEEIATHKASGAVT